MFASKIKLLIKAFTHDNYGVRRDAIEALTKIGSSAVDALIEALKDKNEDIRICATVTLGNIGDKRAVGPLIKTLDDEKRGIAREAAEALGKIGSKCATETLIKILRDETRSDIHDAVAIALGKIGDKRAIRPLVHAAKTDKAVRGYAVRALGWFNNKCLIKLFIEALQDDDWLARSAAAESLGKLGDRRVVELLIERLEEEHFFLSLGSVVEALGELGDPRAVEPLIKLLGSKDRIYLLVLYDVIDSLSKLNDKRAVEPLIREYINEPNIKVRKKIIKALHKLGGESAAQRARVLRVIGG